MEILSSKLDLKKEMGDSQIAIVVMSGADYNDAVVNIAKQLSSSNLGYVTLNKTYSAMKDLFEKKGISSEKILYVDAISKTVMNVPDQTDGCYYVSSPAAMTELSMAISKLLNHNFDYIIFDSVTNLLVYEKKEPVIKFMQFLINKIRASKTKAVFYALKMGEQQDIVQQVEMFVDKVIELK